MIVAFIRAVLRAVYTNVLTQAVVTHLLIGKHKKKRINKVLYTL